MSRSEIAAEMGDSFISYVPYDFVQNECPDDEASTIFKRRYTKCDIWCRLYINRVAVAAVVFLALIVLGFLIWSLPFVHHSYVQKNVEPIVYSTTIKTDLTTTAATTEETLSTMIPATTERTLSTTIGGTTERPPSITIDATTEGTISTMFSQDLSTKTWNPVGESRVMHSYEDSAQFSTFSSEEPEEIDPGAVISSVESEEDNLISTIGLINVGISERESLFTSSARPLPSNATDYTPIDLLQYMKLKATFIEIQCAPQPMPVFKYTVTVMDLVFTGKDQSTRNNAILSAAKVATEELFDIHYRDEEIYPTYGCHY